MDMPPGIDTTREVIEIEDSESDSERKLEDNVANPSVTIARDFETAVKEGFTFDGNFAFSERYTMRDAANPCLKIDGIGTVGLPLGERDALAIISVAEPATPSIWEVSAHKIHFDDPEWDAWIQKTACLAACTSLQLNTIRQTSSTCALRKLVIHGPGSPQTHFQEECSLSETKIAALVVVLPSSFEGGQLQLRHGLETKYVDLAYHSGILTSSIAAYVGVWHTLSSVTSGYRLSLVYDINQPSADTLVRRSLPDTHGPAQNLRRVLQRWKDGTVPEFLACLLRHTYTVRDDENFNTELLYGADGQLVSQLIPLVRELEIRACFAQVTLAVTASASAERFAQNLHYGYTRCDDSESDDSIGEENFDIDEDEKEEEFRVLKVVDLSGMPIDVKIDLETCHLLNGSMTSGNPDDEEFEKYDRTSGRIKETYNRTVVLLWPKGGSLESGVEVGDICDYVSNTFRDSNSVAPTARETELVNMLAESCKLRRRDEKKLKRVVQVLRESTNRWNDAEQFVRGLLACGVDRRTHLLGVEGFVSAYRRFGWDALKDFFETAMKHDESNKRRQVLLLRLSKIAAEENNSEIASWCKGQQENVLRYLSELDAEQLPWLMELSRARGAEFLRDVVFSQLRSQNLDRLFWIPFLRALQENTELIPKSSPDVVEGLILQCFSEVARTLPPFPTKTPKPEYRGQTVSEEADCEPFLEVINLLVQNNHADLCSPIFMAMRDAKQRATYKRNCPPWQYYTKLSPTLIRMIQSSAPATAALSAVFQPFFVDVVESMISPPPPDPNIRSWDKPTSTLVLDSEKLRIFRAAAQMSGGLSVVKSSLISAKLDRHTSSCLQGLARAISEEFRRETPTSPDYSVIVITLARAAVDAFEASSLIPRYKNDSPAELVIGLIKFCFEIGARDVCAHVLERFLPPPTGTTAEKHLSDALSPFVPLLQSYLTTQRLDFQVEPFKRFAAAVITSFAAKVMPQKHTDFVPAELQSIGCGCSKCSMLKEFFVGHKQTIMIRDRQDTRQHLESQLHRTTANSRGIVWETIRTGSPHALKITKPSNMTPRGLWSTNSKGGSILLATLGDEQTQKDILGPDYETVRAQITGVKASSIQAHNGEKRQADSATSIAAKKPRLT